jgi:hypothetical protein
LHRLKSAKTPAQAVDAIQDWELPLQGDTAT